MHTEVTMMRITTVREFRDKATQMFRSKDPILVLRRGEVAGIFFPYPAETLPLEFRRELFIAITDSIGKRLEQAEISKEEILEDFEQFRKGYRKGSRRR